ESVVLSRLVFLLSLTLSLSSERRPQRGERERLRRKRKRKTSSGRYGPPLQLRQWETQSARQATPPERTSARHRRRTRHAGATREAGDARAAGPRGRRDLEEVLRVVDLLGVEEAVELPNARRVAHLAQRLRLDLPDALARDLELLADFLERAAVAVD